MTVYLVVIKKEEQKVLQCNLLNVPYFFILYLKFNSYYSHSKQMVVRKKLNKSFIINIFCFKFANEYQIVTVRKRFNIFM